MRSIRQFIILCFALFISAGLSATTIYVDDNALNDPGPGNPALSDPFENGTSAHPYDAIQEGIDAAADGVDDVLVKEGTYTGDGNRDLDFGGRAITLKSEKGPENTVIYSEGTAVNPHRGFLFESGESADSIVDGFTIRNGMTGNHGGGIYCNASSPTIKNCIVAGNEADDFGGGIACENGSSPNITDCVIMYNSAGYYGGGIYCDYGSAPITNCIITNNSAGFYGGGIFTLDCSSVISHCTVIENESDKGGGIHSSWRSKPTITNCLITDNVAFECGGGISCTDSLVLITNCTLAANSAVNGAALACDSYLQLDPSYVEISDCIFWNGSLQVWNKDASKIIVAYSDVQGGWIGAGNIDKNPLFVSGPLHDYYLSQKSAGQPTESLCVDTGSDTAANLDLDQLTTRNDSEYDTGMVDMGYHSPPPICIYSIARSGNDIIIQWNATCRILVRCRVVC